MRGTTLCCSSVSVDGGVGSCAGVRVGDGVADAGGVVLGVANDADVAPGVECIRVSGWNEIEMLVGWDGVRECDSFMGEGGSGMSSGRSAELVACGGGSVADMGGEMGWVTGVEAEAI